MTDNQHSRDPNEIDKGTMYYLMHAGAYKGHMRGIVRGLIVGAGSGALIGLAFAAIVGAGFLVLPVALAATKITAIFAAFGSVMASNVMGRVGNASGNAAARLAEQEIRERFPELPEVSPDSPQPGYGYHVEVPPDRDRGKWFHSRVGVGAGLLGASFGGLLSFAGLGELISLHLPLAGAAAHGAAAAGTAAVAHGGAAVGAAALAMPLTWPIAVGALFGLSFGINRSHFKTIFNFTDNLLAGRIGGPTASQLEKDRERYRLMGETGPPAVITSLQRQEEYYRLYDGYYKQSFAAGFAGNGRGLVGGMVAGGIFGLLLGGIAAMALTAAGLPLLAPLAFAAVTAATMHVAGTHIFTEAAFEASGHSHVEEIFEERMHHFAKGKEISFAEAEKNVDARRNADPELTPPTGKEHTWFKPRVAAVLGAVGAAVGIGLIPITSGIAGLLGVAGGHLTPAISATVFGLTGASFGLGKKVTGRLHQLGDDIYLGTFHPNDGDPEHKKFGQIPLMSPRSKLAKEYREHLVETQYASQLGNSLSDVAPPMMPTLEYQPAAQSIAAVREIVDKGSRSFTQKAKDMVRDTSQPVIGGGHR